MMTIQPICLLVIISTPQSRWISGCMVLIGWKDQMHFGSKTTHSLSFLLHFLIIIIRENKIFFIFFSSLIIICTYIGLYIRRLVHILHMSQVFVKFDLSEVATSLIRKKYKFLEYCYPSSRKETLWLLTPSRNMAI